jgi:hypothetical protein
MTEASLYERLGGSFTIAAVVDHFSDAVVRNPITGQGSSYVDETAAPPAGRLAVERLPLRPRAVSRRAAPRA